MKKVLSTLIALLAAFSFSLPAFAQESSRHVRIFGTILNGTTGGPARVEKLTVLRPGAGMQTVAALENTGPDFDFPKVEAGGPVLVRAEFKGEVYVQFVSPMQAGKFQTLKVYEPGAPPKSIRITNALQVTKTENGLHVLKLFAAANTSTPPMSSKSGDLSVFVPEKATAVVVRLRHEDSMPVNVETTRDGSYLKVQRGFRPGQSELTVEYNLEDLEFEDRVHRFQGVVSDHPFAVVLWKPDNARPAITGAKTQTVQIPDMGPALQVTYPADTAVNFNFQAGGLVIMDPEHADRNPLFPTPGRALIAVSLALVLFVALLLVSTSVVRRTA